MTFICLPKKTPHIQEYFTSILVRSGTVGGNLRESGEISWSSTGWWQTLKAESDSYCAQEVPQSFNRPGVWTPLAMEMPFSFYLLLHLPLSPLHYISSHYLICVSKSFFIRPKLQVEMPSSKPHLEFERLLGVLVRLLRLGDRLGEGVSRSRVSSKWRRADASATCR